MSRPACSCGMSSNQGLETPGLPVLAGSWDQVGGALVTEEGQGDSFCLCFPLTSVFYCSHERSSLYSLTLVCSSCSFLTFSDPRGLQRVTAGPRIGRTWATPCPGARVWGLSSDANSTVQRKQNGSAEAFCETQCPCSSRSKGPDESPSQHLLNYMGSLFSHNSLVYSKLHCHKLCLTHALPCSRVLGGSVEKPE